jgi:hypothetical protein
MKKKVRIYKAPDGKGKFINKTAKFLRKAQEGGQQNQQAQIADYIYKTLDNTDELDIEIVKDSLIGELAAAKIPLEQAEQMVENIAANFETGTPSNNQQEEETDVYDEGMQELQRQQEEAEEERQAGLAENYGYYDDTAADGEDDEEDEDDEIPENIYMQTGGDVIPEDNPVSFVGYDPMQYTMDKQQSFSHGGMTKRKYVGKVMQLLRKQEGGEDKQPSEMDPKDTADNKKKNLNKGFVDALANTAREAKMKEKAEAMWEQQQQMMQQQAPQYPVQGPMDQVPMAQRGMSVRQMRRMMPRGFGRRQMQSFAGMVPPGGFFPMGMNIMTYPQMQMPEQKPIHVQGTIPGMKLDVRKSHWLTGRPSQYSLEFGGDFAIPGFSMMPGAGYGTKSTQRRKIEGVSRLVNKAADPGKNNTTVLNNNPEYDKDSNGVPDNVQSNIIPSTPGTPSAYDRNANNMLDVTEVKTNLPAVNNNPNKDAVGNGAKLPSKTSTNKTVTNTKSKQVGQNKTTKSSSTSNKKVLSNTTSTSTKGPISVKLSNSWKQPASTYVPPAPTKVVPTSLKKKPVLPSGAKAIPTTENTDPFYMQALKKIGNVAGDYYDKALWALSDWGYQSGGFVDSSNPELYKFVYGGDDIITQQDMNYSDSKNSGSPFFATGGYVKYQKKGEVTEYDKDGNGTPDLIERTPGKNPEEEKKEEPKKPEFEAITSKEDYDKRLAEERKKWEKDYAPKEDQQIYSQGYYNQPYSNYGGYNYPNAFGRYFPANTVRRLGTWTQQQGMPYDPRTGAGYFGGFGPNTQLSKIDVRKSGWLSGRPKKYTMYFNNAEMDPTKPEFSINTGTSQGQPGTQERGWGNEELDTRRERRQAREYDKFMDEINSGYTPSEDEENLDMEKAPTRPMSQIPVGERNLPDALSSNEDRISAQNLGENLLENPMGNVDYASSNMNQSNADAELQRRMDEADAQAITNAENPEMMSEEEVMNAMSNNPFLPGYRSQKSFEDENRMAIEQGQIQPEFGANPQIAMGPDFMPTQGARQIDQEQIFANPNSFPNIFPNQSRDQFNQLYDAPSRINTLGQDLTGMEPNIMSPRNFPQYTDAFEGLPSNDDINLMGTMDGMSEGSVRNREIDAKRAYNANLVAEQNKQKLARQQKFAEQQKFTGQQKRTATQNQGVSGSGSSNTKSGNKDLFSGGVKTLENPKSTIQTYQSQGLFNDLYDKEGNESPIAKSLDWSIMKQWEKMTPSQQKSAGGFNKWIDSIPEYRSFYASKNAADKTGYPSSRRSQRQNRSAAKLAKQSRNNKIKQFGGSPNLNRFVYGDEVTKTSTGTDSPIVYTNNPALEGIRDVDLLTNTINNEFTKPVTIDSFMNMSKNSWASQDSPFNKPTMDFQTGCTEEEKKDPKSPCYDMEKYGIKVNEDALGSARETTEKKYAPKAGQFAVDFKNKNAYEVDAQGMLLSGNALARGLFGALDRRSSRKQNKDFYDRFTSDNLYASDPSRDRGDYDVNSGLYRPNEQGQIWNSRSKQLGGFMQSGGFAEGDVIDMTPEELEEFLANGGEVEIIS